MDVKQIESKLQRLSNWYKNKFEFSYINSKEKNMLRENSIYKNAFLGKRCFVIGNGPSVNDVDFKLLRDEVVITVNDMILHDNFDELGSDFHFLADSAYFVSKGKKAWHKSFSEEIERLKTKDKKTVFFVPIQKRRYVKQMKWDKGLAIHYFKSELYFYDGYKEDIDFTRYIPGFQGVIHWAIAFAIYAGCKEIYLLGCDATNIVDDINLFMNKNMKLSYAYKMSEEVEEEVKSAYVKIGLEHILYGYHRIVHLFAELSKYCNRKKIKLYNCSSKTILDCIPRKDINSVLKK